MLYSSSMWTVTSTRPLGKAGFLVEIQNSLLHISSSWIIEANIWHKLVKKMFNILMIISSKELFDKFVKWSFDWKLALLHSNMCNLNVIRLACACCTECSIKGFYFYLPYTIIHVLSICLRRLLMYPCHMLLNIKCSIMLSSLPIVKRKVSQKDKTQNEHA